MKTKNKTRYGMTFLLIFLFGFFSVENHAGEGHAGSRPHAAPVWDLSEWINSSATTLEKQRGKVVIIEFFQLWCPGCNQFSIPLMQEWGEKYAAMIRTNTLYMVSIHTVFEGHGYQSPERLRKFVKEKGITHPVAIDRHEMPGTVPETMKRYHTGGTPAIAIIDKKGLIRFQRFGGFDPAIAERLIHKLLQE